MGALISSSVCFFRPTAVKRCLDLEFFTSGSAANENRPHSGHAMHVRESGLASCESSRLYLHVTCRGALQGAESELIPVRALKFGDSSLARPLFLFLLPPLCPPARIRDTYYLRHGCNASHGGRPGRGSHRPAGNRRAIWASDRYVRLRLFFPVSSSFSDLDADG